MKVQDAGRFLLAIVFLVAGLFLLARYAIADCVEKKCITIQHYGHEDKDGKISCSAYKELDCEICTNIGGKNCTDKAAQGAECKSHTSMEQYIKTCVKGTCILQCQSGLWSVEAICTEVEGDWMGPISKVFYCTTTSSQQ